MVRIGFPLIVPMGRLDTTDCQVKEPARRRMTRDSNLAVKIENAGLYEPSIWCRMASV